MRTLLRLRYTWMSIACVAALTLTNWLGEVTGYRFWQPGINTNSERVFVFQRFVDHADVVFLGSSRTEQGINAPEIEAALTEVAGKPVSAYSLGVPNAMMLESASFVDNLLVGSKTPKVAVVSVSVQDLYVTPESAMTHYRYYATQGEIYRFLPTVRTEREFEAAMYGLCRGLSSFELAIVANPGLAEFQKRIDENIRQRGSHWRDPNGPKGSRFSDKPDQAEIIESIMKTQGELVVDAKYDGPAVDALRHILAVARERGISVLLLEHPLLPEFYVRFAETQAYKDYKAFIHAFAQKEGVPLFERTGAEMGFTGRDYHDADHMHVEGARKFSRILATDAIAPLLAK